MLKYLRDARSGDVAGPDAIMAYRGGYLPETRRADRARSARRRDPVRGRDQRARARHRHRRSRCGGLRRATPARVAATWQRFGRAGRRGDRPASRCWSARATPSISTWRAIPSTCSAPGAEEARIDPGQRRGPGPAPQVRRLRGALPHHRRRLAPSTPRAGQRRALPRPRHAETRRRAGVPRRPRPGARVSRRAFTGRARRFRPTTCLAAQHRLGQLRDHRRRHRQEHRGARLARCPHHAARASHLPARRASNIRSSVSTSRTTRPSCARWSRTTSRPPSPTAPCW